MSGCEVPRTQKTGPCRDARHRKQENAIASGSGIGSWVESGVEVNFGFWRGECGHEQILACKNALAACTASAIKKSNGGPDEFLWVPHLRDQLLVRPHYR